MRITEVYFRSHEPKKGQQWFEVQNTIEEAINLKQARLRKIDGKKNAREVWVTWLPDEDLILEPGQYAVIAQKADLGQNLCSEHKIIVLKDKNFAFDSKGIQILCLKIGEELEHCVQISDSKKIKKNSSRNLLERGWPNEVCELKAGLFASPGLPMLFCKEDNESGWSTCLEKPVDSEVVAQTEPARRHRGGCQAILGVSDAAFELMGLILVLFVKRCCRKELL